MRHTVKWALLTLFAFSTQAPAAEEPSCKGAPNDAVLTIPEPVDVWAKIVCTPSGHVVTFTSSYGWFSHKSKKLISFSAQPEKIDANTGKHDFYFTKITVEKLSEAIGKVLADAYMPEIYFSLTGYDVPAEVPVMYDVTFINNKGQRLGLNFFVYRKETFGNACWEICAPPIVGFAVAKRPSGMEGRDLLPNTSLERTREP
jgi:hypothetical protein